MLPFENQGDSVDAYFADGITEDLITDLSKVSALFVVARNTAFTFKGQSVDAVEGKFVKQSGGNIEVHSEEGHGTTFKIYLPKADIEASQLPSADNLQATGGTETILCVEDDAP